MRKLIIIAAAFLLMESAHAQNILPNGGFEAPGLPANEKTRFLADGSSVLPGWTVIDDGIGERPFYAQGPYSEAIIAGNYGLILNQGSGVKTTFRTEPGFYELALWIKPVECTRCNSPAPMRVTISGNVYTLPLVSGWSKQTIQFWVTNSINTLEILNPSSSGDYKQYGLDEVSISKQTGALLNVRMYPAVILEGFPGQRYQIQAAPDVNSPMWETLTNIFITNSPVIFVDMDPKRPLDYPPTKRRIYRSILVP